jgi:hypothetical protein
MLSKLINRPCTLIQKADSDETDSHGNPVRTETSIDAVCELQQAQSVEPGGAGESAATTFNAFFLPGIEPNTGDALIVDGHTYEFVGEPWVARNPRTQITSHVQATVKRTTGAGDTGS